jgi:hypothetical protein
MWMIQFRKRYALLLIGFLNVSVTLIRQATTSYELIAFCGTTDPMSEALAFLAPLPPVIAFFTIPLAVPLLYLLYVWRHDYRKAGIGLLLIGFLWSFPTVNDTSISLPVTWNGVLGLVGIWLIYSIHGMLSLSFSANEHEISPLSKRIALGFFVLPTWLLLVINLVYWSSTVVVTV